MNDKISLRKAWVTFSSNPDKWKFLLTWFALYAVIFGISLLINIVIVIPIIGVFLMCILVPVLIVVEFAATFFILGYIYEITDSTRLGEVKLPKILTSYKERLTFGAKIFLVSFIYNLPSVVIATVLYIVFVFGIFTLGATVNSEPFVQSQSWNSTTSTLQLVVLVTIGLISVLLVTFLFVINKFLVDSAVYKFLVSKRDLSKGFKFSSVFQIFKNGIRENLLLFWKNLILGVIVTVITIVLLSPAAVLFIFSVSSDSEISSILGISSLCFYGLGILALYVVLTPVTYYIYPHLVGQIYAIWDKKGLDKV
ncbi:DUF4013 domain-containing protein [Candidatus Dojkabacteria bacterium]|nr:DUF4013 domain-containing protein [Candidatus Dojkabacteria bacterium]